MSLLICLEGKAKVRFVRGALRLHPNGRIQIPAVKLNYPKWDTTARSTRANLIGTVHFYLPPPLLFLLSTLSYNKTTSALNIIKALLVRIESTLLCVQRDSQLQFLWHTLQYMHLGP